MSAECENEFHETKESINQGQHGIDYEFAVASLFFTRVLDNNYEDYKLTREKTGLGKFDDLVLVYKKEEKTSFRLVQIKHIEDATKKISYSQLTCEESYFHLPKYYNHYLKSLESFKADKDFKAAKLQDLIICTNINFEENLDKINLKHINSQDEIFQNDFDLHKLEIPKSEIREIFKFNYLSPMEQLAHELLHYILLDKQINITTLIKDEATSLVKEYHLALAEHVINIDKKHFKEEFLKGNSVDNKNQKFKKVLFQSVIEIAESLNKLSEEDFKSKFNISRLKCNEIKSSLRVFVEKDMIEIEKQLRNYKFKLVGKFDKKESTSDQANVDLPNDITIISTDEVDEKIMDFLEKLVFAVQKCIDVQKTVEKKLGSLYSGFNKKMEEWYYRGSTISKDSKIRKWFTKKNLLGEAMVKNVEFQGRNLKLKELFEEEKNIDDSRILLNVFCGKDFDISCTVPDFKKQEVEYYIERTLNRHEIVRREVLENNKEDIFVISIAPNEESILRNWIPEEENLFPIDDINNSSRFIFTNKCFNMVDFASLIGKSENYNGVHWLEKISDTLIWKHTYGSSFGICKYKENQHFNEKDITANFSDKIKIVSAVPGMGKSFLFSHISRQITQQDSLNLVINVDLKNLVDDFNERKWDYTNPDEITEFISKVANLNWISEALLKHYIENKRKKITLLFHGFDEMGTDDQREEIIKFSKYMKENVSTCSVWISTRPHLKDNLENKLSSIAFSLQEITEDEQIDFLIKWWNTSSSKEIKRYAKLLVTKFSESIKDEERSFLGIPLQTKLLAVAFQNDVDNNKLNVPAFIDLHYLYKTFVESKYNDLFFKYCVNLAENKAGSKTELFIVPIIESLNDAHAHYALTCGILYPLEETEVLGKIKVHFTLEQLLDVGIIYKFGDQFNFTHRTFCEYFAAIRLADLSAKKSRNHLKFQKVLEFLKKLILKPENKLVIYFLDYFVTNDLPLHRSILSGKTSKIEEAAGNDVNKEDAIGRTPLYYALTYRKLDPLIMLLKKEEISVDICNIFICHSISAYLVNIVKNKYFIIDENYYYIIKTLLEKSNTWEFSEYHREQVLSTKLILLALHSKRCDLVNLLISKGAIVNIGDTFLKNVNIANEMFLSKYPFRISLIFPLFIGIINTHDLNVAPNDQDFYYSWFLVLFDIFDHTNVNELVKLSKEYGRKLDIQKYLGSTYFHTVIMHCCNSFLLFLKDFLLDSLRSRFKESGQKKTFIGLGKKIGRLKILIENRAIYNLNNSDMKTPYECLKFEMKRIADFLHEWKTVNVSKNPNEKIRNFLENCVVLIKNHLVPFNKTENLLFIVNQLFMAVQNNLVNVVRRCMSEAHSRCWIKAVTNACNREGKTLREIAKRNCHLEIYAILRSYES